MDNTTDDPTINRRLLLRGGAVLAGAAGVAAAGAVVSAGTADAAVGDPLTIGRLNVAAGPTTLSVGTLSAPVLTLKNTNGPALALQPVADTWNGALAVGQIAATTIGPVVGADFGNGAETVFLASTHDLDGLPSTYSIRPTRVLDTRWPTLPESIVATSDSALDSKQRLKGGAWMDVAIAAADEGLWYTSVFANVAVAAPTKAGYLVVYPPGDLPDTSTLNFVEGQNVSNALFHSVVQVGDSYAVRIYASVPTHVILDVSGVIVTPDNSKTPVTAARKAAAQARERQAALVRHITSSVAARSQQ